MRNNDYDQDAVNGLFSSVVGRYDLMNDIMSLGLHRLWKRQFIERVPCGVVLDLACGTGDIAIALAKKNQVIACDINRDMLCEGMKKAANRGISQEVSWVQCSGEALPFCDSYFDVCTVAFGIRNIENRMMALREILRVLKPRGKFLCMEFSKVDNKSLDVLYRLYSRVIPHVGGIVAGDRAAYSYLTDSIAGFPDAVEYAAAMEECGFGCVGITKLVFGVVAIHEAFKI